MRRRTGAMLTVFALIDIAGGDRLTPEEWRHPDVRAITELANDLVVWDNDLSRTPRSAARQLPPQPGERAGHAPGLLRPAGAWR